MKDITLRNAEQLGAAIRLKRREKGLTQSELAKQVGAERKWILNLESGNSKAEIGLVLRTLEILDLRALLTEKTPPGREPADLPASRLDQVFEHLQRSPRK